MNAKHSEEEIDGDMPREQFYDGLAILARIISRVYQRTILQWKPYFYSAVEQSYVEWPTANVNGNMAFMPITCAAGDVPLNLLPIRGG